MRTYKTPLFEKRHYEWMAATLRSMIKGFDNENEWRAFVLQRAIKLCHSNVNYNKDRFIDACFKEPLG